MKKVRMSNKLFRRIMIPMMALVFIVATIANFVVNYISATMDMMFGAAPSYVSNPDGTDGWMLDYYNNASIGTPQDAKAMSLEVAKQIGDEGIILLKNQDSTLPLKPSTKLTVFGHSSVEPVWGGAGSGGTTLGEETVTPQQAFSNAFENLNKAIYDKSQELLDTGKYVRGGIPLGTLDETSCKIGEFPVQDYGDALDSVKDYNEAGILIVSRVAGEGNDLVKDMVPYGGNAGEHMLELNDDEKAMIRYMKENCQKVIVVVNAATQMELGILEQDKDIDAIIMMGFPGETGFASLADILTGKVNPSGHTADTFYADFTKDPTYQNSDNFAYTSENMVGHTVGRRGPANGEYLEYEEGIYVGYRYYETAAAIFGDEWYNDWRNHVDENNYTVSGTGVVYPFGYGLSYTTFDQKIISSQVKDGSVNLKVKVSNTGSVAGKDVIQIYYTAPYYEGGIEKAQVNLVTFAKSNLIQPGASESYDISFKLEDMASYDWQGEQCYVLDEGEYMIRAMKNAHEEYDSFTYNQPEKIVYNQDNPRQSERDAQAYINQDGTLEDYPAKSVQDPDSTFIAATNHFTNLNEHMSSDEVTNLSRVDFAGTFPTKPSAKRSATDEYAALYDAFDYNTDEKLGNVPGSLVYHEEAPVQGADNGIQLIDLRGKNFYDPMWEDFLDQIVYDQNTLKVTVGANYQTQEISYLGKPATVDHDGPVGFTGSYGTGQTVVACTWCSTTVLASTFNKDLAYGMGLSIGREMSTQETSGWYGPAMNNQRSPFSGRNYEYYSEDPVLSGTIATGEIEGAASQGIYAELKHFILNDEEVNRNAQCSVWVNEQALREIYMKPFEICVKSAWCETPYISDDQGTISTAVQRATRGIMTSHFQIGADHDSESYELLTEVLRNEWGFTGFVETDMMDGINADKRIRAGGNISMIFTDVPNQEDLTSPTAQWAFRRAIHEICYTQVNSRAVSGMAPGATIKHGMRPWIPYVIAADVAVVLLLTACAIWIRKRQKAQELHPECFAGTPEGDAIKAQIVVDPKKRRAQIVLIAIIIVALVIAAAFGVDALLKWIDQL